MSDNRDDAQKNPIDREMYQLWLEERNRGFEGEPANPHVSDPRQNQQQAQGDRQRQQKPPRQPSQGPGLLKRVVTSVVKQLTVGFVIGTVLLIAFATYVSTRVNAYAAANSVLNGVQGGGQDIVEKLKNPITESGGNAVDDLLNQIPDLVYVISPIERLIVILLTVAICLMFLIKLKPFVVVGIALALVCMATPYNEFFVVQDLFQVNWFVLMPDPSNPLNMYGFGASSR